MTSRTSRAAQRGMSLGELMVVIAVLGVIALGLGFLFRGGCANVTGANHDKAEAEAVAYGKKVYRESFVGATCVTADSDGDGYVTCTISVRRPDGSIYTEGAECAAAYQLSQNQGCKPQAACINRGAP